MTSEQLATSAKAKPGLLIVYHSSISWWPRTPPSGNQLLLISTGEFDSTPDALEKELSSRYAGHFVIGRDLVWSENWISRSQNRSSGPRSIE
jgi:hypothetical protein